MKTTHFLFFFFWFFVGQLQAQKIIEKSFPLTSAKEVFLNLKYASEINLKYHDKAEVFIKVSVNINDNAHNDNFELSSSQEKDVLIVKASIKDISTIAGKKTTVNKDERSTYYYGNQGYWDEDNKVYITSGKQIQADIHYEIFVPANIPLKLKTISGNIQGNYEKGQLSLETISGDIDLYFAEKQKNNIQLKTLSGDVYSNLSLELEGKDKNDLKRVGGGYGTNLTAKLNGGGEEISLKSINGNIYLRKK